MKRICVLPGNDFNETGVSDALVGIGEATYPAGKKIVTEGETGMGF